MISIVTVNWWAKEFLDILIESIKKHTTGKVELVVVDNSKELSKVPGIDKLIKPDKNIGHGLGMNRGIKEASGEYILALDIDTHILLDDWDTIIKNKLNRSNLELLGGEGGMLKPIRPCVMFFKRDFFIKHNMSFEAKNFEGAKFDVGIHFYFKTLSLNYRTVEILKYAKTTYEDVIGNEYMLNDKNFVYHNWYGTRFYNPGGGHKDKVDSITYNEFITKRDNLFKQLR